MPYGNNERGVFAPGYYNSFRCIADRCRHSCCIDWEICIDGETLEKYRKSDGIMNTVTECDDGVCFELMKDGRCPHLNERGLCDIIISHGEEYLCEICRNHPRFYNDLGGGRMEAGLGIVCEEACRIILESDEPFRLTKVDDADEFYGTEISGFDVFFHRDRIMRIIEREGSFDNCLSEIREIYGLPEDCSSDEWIDFFLSLEILEEDWKKTLNALKGSAELAGGSEYDQYYKRLLAYFVYRHVSIAENETALRARLAFADLSVRIIRRIFESSGERSAEKLIDTARRYSAEIEYSEENTDELIFELEIGL